MKKGNYEEEIKELVKRNDLFTGKDIKSFKWEASSSYYPEKIDEVFELARNGDFAEIEHEFNPSPKTFGDLSFFSFSLDIDKKCIVIIYDSDEFWQDPEIFKIIEI